jgi:hypothetical protein
LRGSKVEEIEDPLLFLSTKKSPPENYGKEDQTTVAAFLLWRGS